MSFQDSHLEIIFYNFFDKETQETVENQRIEPVCTFCFGFKEDFTSVWFIKIPSFMRDGYDKEKIKIFLQCLNRVDLDEDIIIDLRGNFGGHIIFVWECLYSLFGFDFVLSKKYGLLLETYKNNPYIKSQKSMGWKRKSPTSKNDAIMPVSSFVLDQLEKRECFNGDFLWPPRGSSEDLNLYYYDFLYSFDLYPYEFSSNVKFSAFFELIKSPSYRDKTGESLLRLFNQEGEKKKIIIVVDKDTNSSSLIFIDFLKIIYDDNVTVIGEKTGQLDRRYGSYEGGTELYSGNGRYFIPTTAYLFLLYNNMTDNRIIFQPDYDIELPSLKENYTIKDWGKRTVESIIKENIL